jgi:RNA polymerase-binding protein
VSLRTTPDIRGRRQYRPEPPAPRQEVAYRCERGHRFGVMFSAEAEPPQAVDCRCGAAASMASEFTTNPANMLITTEHARRMEQLRGRRSAAELEEILADRLGELAAMREIGRTGP